MSVIDPYTHMEEAWKLDSNPFPSEGIRRNADEPFSPGVFPEETADFYRKLVRGAILGSKGVGFLWSQGVGGDTGYGKTTLMQTAAREINRDLGATVLQLSGMRADRLVTTAAVYTNLNNLNATGLYPVLFNGVIEAATPSKGDLPILDKARQLIADRVGDDARAIAADLMSVGLRIAPNGVPLRPELIAAFASGGAGAVLGPALGCFTGGATAERSPGTSISCSQLSQQQALITCSCSSTSSRISRPTSRSTPRSARARSAGSAICSNSAPYAGRLHFVFTFHNTAAQVLEKFWSVNRLPRFEIAPDNTASVVVLRGVSNDDQVAELLKVYISDRRLEHVDDELLPFEPDALGVLRTVSQGRAGILLGQAHELLNAAAERGLPRIDGDFASRYFEGAVDTSVAAAETEAVDSADIDDLLVG